MKSNINIGTGRGWLHRMVRSWCAKLLGKHNTKRLYDENDAAEQLEAYAKERGMTVVSCDDPAWDEALLNWVVNPLADAKEEKPEEGEKGFALNRAVSVKRECPTMPAPPSIVKACHQCSIFIPERGLLISRSSDLTMIRRIFVIKGEHFFV